MNKECDHARSHEEGYDTCPKCGESLGKVPKIYENHPSWKKYGYLGEIGILRD